MAFCPCSARPGNLWPGVVTWSIIIKRGNGEMNQKKRTLKDLAGLSTEQLEEIFQKGLTPDPEKLVGWEFNGYNIPFIAKLIGVKKFKKGFYQQGDEYWGYNIPVEQNPVDQPWQCRPSDDNPRRYAFYSVKPVTAQGKENKEPGALILNYGDGRNPVWEGSLLRDYLKQVDPDNDDLYLAKVYIALGPARAFPTFFIMERHRRAPGEIKR